MASILETYTDATNELGAVGQMWNPFQLVYTGDRAVNVFATFIHSMQNIGLYLLVFMAALKFVKLFMDELNGIPAVTALLGVGVELTLAAVFLLNYTWFAEALPLLFHRLTRVVLDSYDGDMMKQVVESLKAVGGEKSSDAKWFSVNIMLASIPNIISTAMAGVAMALIWVMSKYQAVIYTFWYLIGPLLIPFYLFPPFRGVAERWFGSLLGASFMGVVGAIMFMLMVRMQWLTKSFSSGVSSSYISAMVFSILIVLLMISIPKLSNSIWQGISASMTQAMATASMVGGAVTTVAIGGAGAATQVAGTSIRTGAGVSGILNRYSETGGQNMSASARIRDAITNRNSYRNPGGGQTRGEKMLAGVHQFGSGLSNAGFNTVMSQMPSSVQRMGRALQKTEGEKASQNDKKALQEYVASKVGREKASNILFPEGFRIRPGINQTYDQALKSNGDRLAKGIERDAAKAGVLEAASKLVGPEKASALVMPEFFAIKPRKGQNAQQAIAGAAEGLLRKQGLLDESTQVKMDHSALKEYMTKKLGPEKAKDILVPSAWRVVSKRGQSRQQAIEGSATALMQHLGLIDKKKENAIARRYTFAQARKNPPSPDSKGKKNS